MPGHIAAPFVQVSTGGIVSLIKGLGEIEVTKHARSAFGREGQHSRKPHEEVEAVANEATGEEHGAQRRPTFQNKSYDMSCQELSLAK